VIRRRHARDGPQPEAPPPAATLSGDCARQRRRIRLDSPPSLRTDPRLEHLDLIFLLTLAAFAAGYVDAIAGGGGLIALPALLLAGLSPVEAVATNKLQGTAGVLASSYTFWKAGKLDLPALRLAVPAAAAGSAAGCLLVGILDPALLRLISPVLLIAIALYFAFAHRPEGSDDLRAVLAPARLAAIALPVALYDGFLGPGAGSFYMMGLVAFGGLGLLPAMANTKVLNLTSNVVALAIFLAAGSIVFWAGVPMALAQFAGSRLGARSAIRHGSRLIRPLLVTVSVLMAGRLLWDAL
jgi:uncharacterized membrane protein YfcA